MSDNQMNPDSWAELFRLREEVKGPEGFATWKDAAISEKVKRIEQAAEIEALKAQLAGKWIAVSERLPDLTPVLVVFINYHGKQVISRACWAEKHTLEAGHFEGDTDYDEVTDESYWPEGWYEWNEAEETHWLIEGVTHWQALPQPPKD